MTHNQDADNDPTAAEPGKFMMVNDLPAPIRGASADSLIIDDCQVFDPELEWADTFRDGSPKEPVMLIIDEPRNPDRPETDPALARKLMSEGKAGGCTVPGRIEMTAAAEHLAAFERMDEVIAANPCIPGAAFFGLSVPADITWKLYGELVCRRLCRVGQLDVAEAREHVAKRTELAARHLDDLLADAVELSPQLTVGRVLTCVYCGHEYPQDTPAHGADILTEHIKVCDDADMAPGGVVFRVQQLASMRK